MATILPIQLGSFQLAGAGSSIGDTQLVLKSFKTLGGTNLTMADFGTIGYATIEPNNRDKEEQISFTGVTQNANGTATLTGVKTVLMTSPYTETSGLATPHAGSVTFIISNTSAFTAQFTTIGGDHTITGTYTFSTLPLLTSDPTLANQATRKTWVDSNFCALTGAQTIAGLKTFSTLPQQNSYVAPTINTEFATKKYVDDTAVSGSPDANTTTKGIVQEATLAEINADTAVGSTGARLYVNPSTLATSKYAVANTPTIQKFEGTETTMGSTTTQFDITNPAGTTFRYTWDGTGTDPVISAVTLPVGTRISIYGRNFTSQHNTGTFIVTGSGSNYFEVTNASGVVATNQVLTNGFLKKNSILTWTKPANLTYIKLRGVGAGNGGGSSTSASDYGSGGGGGEYGEAIIEASSLGSTESVYIGIGGPYSLPAGAASSSKGGCLTAFGSLVTMAGGTSGNNDNSGQPETGGDGGTGGTGADLYIPGGSGDTGYTNNSSLTYGGKGGDSVLGFGGNAVTGTQNGSNGKSYGGGGSGSSSGASTSDFFGGQGKSGVIIIEEYYN